MLPHRRDRVVQRHVGRGRHQRPFGRAACDERARGEGLRLVQEAVLLHPDVVVHLAERAVAAVGHDHDEHVVVRERLPVRLHPLERAGHRHAARAAEEHPLLARETAGHEHRLPVRDAHVVVHDVEVHVAREDVLPDPLGHVRVDLVLVELAGVEVLPVDGAEGVHADDPHAGVPFLEVGGGARNRAAGAGADEEVRDPLLGPFPQFRARRPDVGRRVRRVVVLVHVEGVGRLLRETARDLVVGARILGVHRRGADDDLRPQRPQDRDLLGTLLVRGREDAPVAARDGGEREAHAGVAARALDDRAAGRDLAPRLGILEHRDPDPVLDGAAGVEVLELREDGAGEVRGQAVHAHQRSPADRSEDVVVPHGDVRSATG